ncbi:FAD binding domain-containing protein [Clostridium sp. Marseille-P2415]|uniref:FAD binding domain-containing protein n=1 Tax=Clostridium sp. Marseille-P2415 TaxID=1805471 RepID=UPI000988866B|nr:FAD binding domain-containing protein [Clostridium sp. Marseille-P2415]
MVRFKNYVKAESLKEAFELNQKKSSIIGGGMMWLKVQNRVRMTLVDLSGLGLDEIEETEEAFSIGAMCTLRQLEKHEGLNAYFNGIFKECTRSIVGVQFRNGATVGGSVFGRFGFSDILTCLLALDTCVELYRGGMVSLEEFCRMKCDRDILVRIRIKKDGRRAAYASQRMSKTDFPVIACCVAKKEGHIYVSVGARPGKAELVVLEDRKDRLNEAFAQSASEHFRYGTNMRGSADYRKHLAEIYIRRLLKILDKEGR